MSKNEGTKWVGVVGRMLLTYALVFAQGAWATQNQVAGDRSASPQRAASQQAQERQSAAATAPIAQRKQARGEESESVAGEKSSVGGLHQGIKIHGHWTVEVRNPDGTVVTHRDFENSLETGSFVPAAFLSRTHSVGYWSINLVGGVCNQGVNGPGDCLIAEPGSASSSNPNSSVTFYTLSLSSTAAGTSLVLSGTVTAQLTGNIVAVETRVDACPPTTAPSSPCNPSLSNYGFTSAVLASAIQASGGQTVAVTVNLSFS